MTQDEYIESARQRVRAFLGRYAEMRGLDPKVLYSIGDKNGDVISLHWADLNALVCAVPAAPEPWIEQEVARAAEALRNRAQLNSGDDQTHE